MFDTLCHSPEIARERPEFTPPIRLHPHRSHLIAYRAEADHLAILRILHMRQNWREILGE